MTFLQIKYFLMVAKCLNMSEAARRLYMTQPTLSRQISAMEAELNLQLFYRSKKQLQLTPAGRTLEVHFAAILQDYQTALEQARVDSQGFSGTLNIGILDGHTVSDFLPELLKRLALEYPNISIDIQRHTFSRLIEGLYNRTLNLIISMEFDVVRRNGIRYKTIECKQNYLVVPKTHPKAGLQTVSLLDFQDEVFITNSPEDSPVGMEQLINSCCSAGFSPKIKMASSLEEYMLYIESGMGIGVLSERNRLFQNPELAFLSAEYISPCNIVLAWNEENISPITLVGIELIRC